MGYLIPTRRRNALDLWNEVMDFDKFFTPSLQEKKTLLPLSLDTDENNVYITAEIPGVAKEDIQIEYNDGVVTISGEKKSEVKEEKKDFFYTEISYGSFSRRIQVGDIDFDKSTAGYENGLLKVTLPKSEAKKPKKLAVK